MNEHGKDHNIDRREADQTWRLAITRQLTAAEIKIDRLQTETEKQNDKLDSLHESFESAIYGNIRQKGLTTKYLDLEEKLESLRSFLWKVLPWIALALIIVGDRLSPLIFDWIYDKTHVRLFYDPVKEFKEEKATTHVKHYHIYLKRPVDENAE